MSFTATSTKQINIGGTVTTVNTNFTNTLELKVNESVLDGSTVSIELSLALSAISLLWIVVDKNVTMTTNYVGDPDDTINLTANNVLEWDENSYYAIPFTTDITSINVTNNAGSTAVYKLFAIVDATP